MSYVINCCSTKAYETKNTISQRNNIKTKNANFEKRGCQ